MNKMTGIILMVIGALVLGVGIYVYSSSNKHSELIAEKGEVSKIEIINDTLSTQTVVDSSVVAKPEIKSEPAPAPTKKPKDNELEKVIEMAIADGVLTQNERELIKKTAISKGVDYMVVLDDVEKRVKLLEIDSETELVNLNEKNGLEFEEFVVQKFNKKLYTIKEWASDKYVKGVYAESNQHPDILLEFIGYKQNKQFAVECKWRQNTYRGGIDFSTLEQLDRYRAYAKKKKVPVFMLLGLGGKGATPEKLYIVPLKDISEPFMHLNELKKYEKNLDANFFFDYKKMELK